MFVLSACGAVTTDEGAADDKTVDIAINPWVGYEADAAVAAYPFEEKLGYQVEKKGLKEEVAWQGFETGQVDLVIENWGHESLKKKYIEEKKVAVQAGTTGNKGVIGWYVPGWMADRYPGITNWRNLNKYADLFKTSESGGKGQLLDGDPSFVTNDEALVKNLNLDYKVVYSGSEAATIKAAQQAAKHREPLLFYFWEPHWIHAQEDFVKVDLPAYKPGCDSDPKQVACDYPLYHLDKIASKSFAENGGKGYQFIENFRWTNQDQDEVAGDIARGKSPQQAARAWVESNKAVWQDWIPEG
ncbi:MAG: ABC transporter substrate-binding protein [Carbonactinosporaceae bacterium]